jgi:hypothetical protein
MQFFDPSGVEPERNSEEVLTYVRQTAGRRKTRRQVNLGTLAVFLVAFIASMVSFDTPVKTGLVNVFSGGGSDAPPSTTTTEPPATTTTTSTVQADSPLPKTGLKFVSAKTVDGRTTLVLTVSGESGRTIDSLTTDWGDGSKLYEQSGWGGACDQARPKVPWKYENEGFHQYRNGGKFTVKVTAIGTNCDGSARRTDVTTFTIEVPKAAQSNGAAPPVISGQVLYDHVYSLSDDSDGYITHVAIIWPDGTKQEFNYPLSQCKVTESGFPETTATKRSKYLTGTR